MEREEFIEKWSGLHRVIELANKAIKALEKQFVEGNMPYPIGTKVKVTYKEGAHVEYGVVTGAELNVLNMVVPIIHKVKKDGTPSKYGKLFLWSDTIVEPITE